MKNAFYAQSGGVTAVINTTACAVIETARQHSDKIGKVFAGRNGIIGALRKSRSTPAWKRLKPLPPCVTPGGAFGSCRCQLKTSDKRKEYERLIEVFKSPRYRVLFYNGGGTPRTPLIKFP